MGSEMCIRDRPCPSSFLTTRHLRRVTQGPRFCDNTETRCHHEATTKQLCPLFDESLTTDQHCATPAARHGRPCPPDVPKVGHAWAGAPPPRNNEQEWGARPTGLITVLYPTFPSLNTGFRNLIFRTTRECSGPLADTVTHGTAPGTTRRCCLLKAPRVNPLLGAKQTEFQRNAHCCSTSEGMHRASPVPHAHGRGWRDERTAEDLAEGSERR